MSDALDKLDKIPKYLIYGISASVVVLFGYLLYANLFKRTISTSYSDSEEEEKDTALTHGLHP